jgi:hypothetical protein
MWTPDDLVDAQEDFLEFLDSSGQTCDIRRPAESQDALGVTIRSFPTVVAEDVPCVIIHESGGIEYEELADQSMLRNTVEILLPLDVNVNPGDQVITEDYTFSIRKLDEVGTHSLVQHVWAVFHARTA